jgi:hypothetical protein
LFSPVDLRSNLVQGRARIALPGTGEMSDTRLLVKTILLLGLMLAAGCAHAEDRARLNTIAELLEAVHKCWVPPPLAQAHAGMQITVQFSITRDGRLQGKAAIRYESPDASDEERLAYRRSVAESLAHCAPFPITDGLGDAVAGHPLNIRFIDARKQRQAGLREAGRLARSVIISLSY